MKLPKRPLHITTVTAVALLALGAIGAQVVAYPWNGLSLIDRWREMRSGSIFYSGSPRERVVALTFDDGPDPRYTPRVLDILRREHVKATFFVTGRMLALHPDLGRRIAREGHVLGNHTETHPRLEVERNPDVRSELDGCEARIEAVSGERTYLFRPPRGLWNPTVFADARQHGYSIVLWSLAFDRRAERDSANLRQRVVRLARPGDIILMHDGSASLLDERGPTVRELAGVIEGLRRRGFRFATVPELLHVRGDQPVAAHAPAALRTGRV